jgi:hypothetical protein
MLTAEEEKAVKDVIATPALLSDAISNPDFALPERYFWIEEQITEDLSARQQLNIWESALQHFLSVQNSDNIHESNRNFHKHVKTQLKLLTISAAPMLPNGVTKKIEEMSYAEIEENDNAEVPPIEEEAGIVESGILTVQGFSYQIPEKLVTSRKMHMNAILMSKFGKESGLTARQIAGKSYEVNERFQEWFQERFLFPDVMFPLLDAIITPLQGAPKLSKLADVAEFTDEEIAKCIEVMSFFGQRGTPNT